MLLVLVHPTQREVVRENGEEEVAEPLWHEPRNWFPFLPSRYG